MRFATDPMEVVTVLLLGTGPGWLEELTLDLSGLDLLADLDPGLLAWDPELEPTAA